LPEHYYSQQPSSKEEMRTFADTLRGRSWTFQTNAGVFSKGGVDFGSRLLIETMEIPEDADVLDMGCGYGPIGLTAACLAVKGRVTLVDINERAVELARQNALRNGISNVEILQSNLFERLQGRTFRVILCNPPIRAGKRVVHTIFEQAREHLPENGKLWIVIQKKQGAPSAWSKLRELYGKVEEVARDKGYRIFCATNERIPGGAFY
jgi:16S rRNA (guanine1207-N2)-methyltransferase